MTAHNETRRSVAPRAAVAGVLVLLVAAALVLALRAKGGPAQQTSGPSQAEVAPTNWAGEGADTDAPAPGWSAAVTLPQVPFAQLPPQAQETIRVIRRGGPFPFKHQDGMDYDNGLTRKLPARPYAYYRQYGVPEPGTGKRSRARVVKGDGDEYYYAADGWTYQRVDLTGAIE